MEEISEILQLLNPWWDKGEISHDLAKPFKREIFAEITNVLKYRHIIILSGLRRVGKTTLLYQMIELLLKEKNKKNILYFNFDKKTEELTEILNHYSDLVDIDWKKEKIFVFFDEITKLDDWARKLKLIYDAFPNLKIFVSSSSSIGLEEEAIKNLGGRYFLKNVKPLSFAEYLNLRGKTKLIKNVKLYEREIERESRKYLLRSFPETVEWDDPLVIKDYLRTTIIDKIVKSDLPDKFGNVNRDLLYNLIRIFYQEPGTYLDYESLSKKFRISKNTLSDHISYLEYSYLIRRLRNFRVRAFASSRKLQRIYPYWWTLLYCYTENPDKIFETVVGSVLDAKYYWRKNGKEIDFLHIKEKSIFPIEVKNKIELSSKDKATIIYFVQKYKTKKGTIIYNGKKSEEKIKYIPLWKWLLEA